MIRSKLALLTRMTLGNARVRQFSTSGKLNHGKIFYREEGSADRKYFIAAEVMGGFMWWWIFWHLFTDYGHVIGEFEFPDVTKWTNEELGVPPDSED